MKHPAKTDVAVLLLFFNRPESFGQVEDDDVPSQSFFPFCKEMLDRYEHESCETFMPQAHIVEGLEDDGGGRHGEHTAQVDAVQIVT